MNREKQNASKEARGLVSQSSAQRVESLLTSLHGVRAARVELGPDQKPRAVYVVPMANTAPKGITRNVQSGLMAALGLSLEPRAIFIVSELPQPVSALEPVVLEVETAKPQPAQRKLVGIGRIGLPAATPGYKQPPRIEVLELTRLAGDELQCKVVVEVGGRRRTGIAQAGEEREGAVTLAARATLDALRFIEPAEWVFEGAADVIIAGQRHIVVSVCRNEDVASVSGAAPVHESVEHAVAIAVLNAAGLSGAHAVDTTRRLAAHQR